MQPIQRSKEAALEPLQFNPLDSPYVCRSVRAQTPIYDEHAAGQNTRSLNPRAIVRRAQPLGK